MYRGPIRRAFFVVLCNHLTRKLEPTAPGALGRSCGMRPQLGAQFLRVLHDRGATAVDEGD